MGIKEFIQRATCPKCNNGVLLPYSWKTCQLHDPLKRKKLSPTISEVKPAMFGAFTFKCDRKKALESEMLVYDENMNIIGYKSHFFG